MNQFLFGNALSTTLALPITTADTQITVQAGESAGFPVPTASQTVHLTLADVYGNIEIVRVVSRTGDTFTVERAQEGTVARNFNAGDRVELRLTKAMLDNFVQVSGATMEGDLDMANNELKNAVVTKLQPPDRAADGTIELRNGGMRPKVGTNVVLTADLLANVIFMYSGPESSIPPHFKLCDGTDGTPDLRDKFIIASGPNHPAGTTGGSNSVTTSTDGAHDHGGATGGHALTVDEMPAHTHDVQTYKSGSGGSDVINSYAGSIGGTSTVVADAALSEGGGQAHSHTISSDGAHSHTVTVEPVYYALAFVMLKPEVL